MNRELKLSLMFFVIANIAGPAISAPEPDREPEVERVLTSRYRLNMLCGQSTVSPFGIAVDRDGIGHLQPYFVFGTSFGDVPICKDWYDRTSYSDPDTKERVQVTFDKAKTFWGNPTKHTSFGDPYYSFAAHSEPVKEVFGEEVNEDNIYHLDLKFDAKNTISGYRIRGIGIGKPEWITSEWMPKTVIKTRKHARMKTPDSDASQTPSNNDRASQD
jgi:hypothetical protein